MLIGMAWSLGVGARQAAPEGLMSSQPLYPAFAGVAQHGSTEDTLSQPDYNRAFRDGAAAEYTLQDGTGAEAAQRYTLHLHAIGELVVTSGHILA